MDKAILEILYSRDGLSIYDDIDSVIIEIDKEKSMLYDEILKEYKFEGDEILSSRLPLDDYQKFREFILRNYGICFELVKPIYDSSLYEIYRVGDMILVRGRSNHVRQKIVYENREFYSYDLSNDDDKFEIRQLVGDTVYYNYVEQRMENIIHTVYQSIRESKFSVSYASHTYMVTMKGDTVKIRHKQS